MRVSESVQQFGAFSRAQVLNAGGDDATIRETLDLRRCRVVAA